MAATMSTATIMRGTIMAERHAAIDAAEDGALSRGNLVRLMTWLSPAFPVGAFSYSHGIERAIDAGMVRDAASLAAWLDDVLVRGGGWADAVLFAESWRAAERLDMAALEEVADLAAALAPGAERQLETMAQGTAFLAHAAAWPCAPAALLARTRGGRAAYPVAVAAVAAGHGIALEDALCAYLNAFAANLVSVAVRLVPLGQRAGLGVLAGLQPALIDLAGLGAGSSLDDLGNAAIMSDIFSLAHETQACRVFRT